MSTPEHNEIDEMRTLLQERQIALGEDTRKQIALDVGLRNHEAIGAIKEAQSGIQRDIAEVKGDIKAILVRLGVAWFDLWLQRAALLAVAAAGAGVVWWLVQVAKP